MVIKRLKRFFGRRPPKVPAPLQPVAAAQTQPPIKRPRRAGPVLLTWESELRAIAAETSAWTVETGGDLFGRWQASPVVFLATKAGPKAQRDNAHFRLDVDYLRQLSEPLAAQWTLRYFGDWHSHHRLGLQAPSSGDRRRIRQLGNRNAFPRMAEIIVTTEGAARDPIVRVHPWFYDLSAEGDPVLMDVKVLSGCSPIRHALITRSEFPEQALRIWEQVPLERVRLTNASGPPVLENAPEIDPVTRDKVMSHLADALAQESGAPVEQHATAFGTILVTTLGEPHHLAFAIEGGWPLSVLEVHRMNRNMGTTDSIDTPDGLIASDIAGIVGIFHAAKSGRERG
jgi:hypothetical protein